MRSKPPEPLKLNVDLPTTPEDVRALRELRGRRPPEFLDYLDFLSRQRWPAAERHVRKTHEGIEPFAL